MLTRGHGLIVVLAHLFVGAASAIGPFTQPGQHTFTIPDGCTQMTAQAWGAGGGAGGKRNGGTGYGGDGGGGGYVRAAFDVSAGQSFTVRVGQGGVRGVTNSNTSPAEQAWSGGAGGRASANDEGGYGGDGGGYTSLMRSSATYLVAGGGGGGGGASKNGGTRLHGGGGGEAGKTAPNGVNGSSGKSQGGGGGTQNSGGSKANMQASDFDQNSAGGGSNSLCVGTAGTGPLSSDTYGNGGWGGYGENGKGSGGGGGGGAGWYGGGGGSGTTDENDTGGGGGGGSSFICSNNGGACPNPQSTSSTAGSGRTPGQTAAGLGGNGNTNQPVSGGHGRLEVVCPVPCAVSWAAATGTSGQCTCPCASSSSPAFGCNDYGTRSEVASVTRQAADGGTACPNPLTRTGNCSAASDCQPRNCVGTATYTSCLKTCGPETRTGTFNVQTVNIYGGLPCDFEGQTVTQMVTTVSGLDCGHPPCDCVMAILPDPLLTCEANLPAECPASVIGYWSVQQQPTTGGASCTAVYNGVQESDQAETVCVDRSPACWTQANPDAPTPDWFLISGGLTPTPIADQGQSLPVGAIAGGLLVTVLVVVAVLLIRASRAKGGSAGSAPRTRQPTIEVNDGPLDANARVRRQSQAAASVKLRQEFEGDEMEETEDDETEESTDDSLDLDD